MRTVSIKEVIEKLNRASVLDDSLEEYRRELLSAYNDSSKTKNNFGNQYKNIKKFLKAVDKNSKFKKCSIQTIDDCDYQIFSDNYAIIGLANRIEWEIVEVPSYPSISNILTNVSKNYELFDIDYAKVKDKLTQKTLEIKKDGLPKTIVIEFKLQNGTSKFLGLALLELVMKCCELSHTVLKIKTDAHIHVSQDNENGNIFGIGNYKVPYNAKEKGYIIIDATEVCVERG